MNSEKDKDLDDLFKGKLEDPVDTASYNDGDWVSLEQQLDKGKQRKIIYWLPVLSGAAALLLLFLGWWAYRPQVASHKAQSNRQTNNHQKAAREVNRNILYQQKDTSSKQVIAAGVAKTVKNGNPGGSNKSSFPSAAKMPRYTAIPDKQGANNTKYQHLDEVLFAVNPAAHFKQEQIDVPAVYAVQVRNKNVVAAIPQNNKNIAKIKPRAAYRPQFALSIIAAPDINGVGSFQQSRVGTNEGLLFSAGLSKKFTVSTGAIYSVKPYFTGFGNYHTTFQFGVNPLNVTADCKMLDIPLNVGYQVYSKHQTNISIGTGLSSYVMLHESYRFNYANSYSTGPAQYTAPGVNKYIFGVLNINATYERQVNSKFGITVQPYLKLPLTNIGYSQVKLQTTGVALGVSWNLNSSAKP